MNPHKLHKLRKRRKVRPHGAAHRSQRRMRSAVAMLGLALGAVSTAHAQQQPVNLRGKTPFERRESPSSLPAVDVRWREAFDAFAALDRERTPAAGGIVFVGSSSIRLWDGLEDAFGVPGIVKRGFGGSRLEDCARYAAQLVIPYRPRTVVVYAGDNDLAEGATPEDVLARYQAFVEQVHAALPETRIVYVSIKPSPLRAALMPAAIRSNALIARYGDGDPRLRFIDVYSRMLDEQGRPRGDLFLGDALHLNAAGYAIWTRAIAEHLK